MIVKWIRLRNFRLVEDSVLEPLESGVTGLVGPNGAGKSSFLMGLRWALFGARPRGETNASLIRQASLEDDPFECFVEAAVSIDGKTMIAKRMMTRRGAVSAKVSIDGTDVSVDSTGAANKAIISFLGMTPEMFDIAHIIGQGELNALVDAKPAPRRALIEESAGIDVLSDSVSAASTDLSSTPAVVDLSDEVERARSEHERTEGERRRLEAALSTIPEPTDVSGLEHQLSELRDKRSKFERVEGQRNTLTKILSSIDVTGGIVEVPDVPEPDPSLQQALADSRSHERERTAKSKALDALPEVEPVDESSIQALIDKGVDWLASRRAQLNTVTSELDEAQKFDVDAIGDDVTTCPLCGSEIHDPEVVRAEREKKTQILTTQMSELKTGISKGESRLKTLRSQLREAKSANEVVAKRDKLISEINAIPVDDVSRIEEDLKNETSMIREMRTRADNARQHNDLVRRRDDVLSQIQDLPDIDPVGDDEISEIESRIQESRDQDRKRMEALYALRNAEDASTRALASLTDLEKRNESAKKANEERFIKSTSVAVLRAYREEMLATLGPEMEENMSGLVSDMTGGEYISVRLDDSFGVFVTSAAGEERSVTSLSGGERAVVSLAMRMSLGGSGISGLLWMDEVGGALDGERLTTFMSGLHELNRQVIVIDHREAASVEYDKTIRFERSSDSSRIISE